MQRVANENFPLDNRRHLLLALTKPKVTLQVARFHAAYKGPEVSHALVGGHVLVVAGRIQSGSMVEGGVKRSGRHRVGGDGRENSRNVLRTHSCRPWFYNETNRRFGGRFNLSLRYRHEPTITRLSLERGCRCQEADNSPHAENGPT